MKHLLMIVVLFSLVPQTEAININCLSFNSGKCMADNKKLLSMNMRQRILQTTLKTISQQ